MERCPSPASKATSGPNKTLAKAGESYLQALPVQASEWTARAALAGLDHAHSKVGSGGASAFIHLGKQSLQLILLVRSVELIS